MVEVLFAVECVAFGDFQNYINILVQTSLYIPS